ncbi:DUF2786 domain-containing protein [Rhodococcus oxybenzonivorans]|uniref:DUF2786 domain-containing protein n=1 Tax=Rhodococcus TaxID=1827 RepID=UPI00131FCB2F|nr:MULTISPECIES: DUF2786 domain-containing protein [Rhodococcus]MDV7354148.1 DUF2786 domain-containing protein [Rhodococcus oxybenzonivorans]QHE71312.1 hypothetical protein GFS60_04915 [Rhodococcus sp. WAY2]
MFDDEVSPPAAAAVHTLLGELSAAYERGWQPADVLHLARRSKEPADAPLAAALVLHEAERTRAQDRAPHDWLGQLRTIAEQYPAASDLAQRISDRVGDAMDDMSDDAGVRALAAGLLFEDPYHSVYQLTDLSLAWTDLPGWTVLTPPPSTWPRVRVEVTGSVASGNTEADAKVLNRIRGLLAKAEATDFAEEAEIFTAKAQELMTRYAINAALLHTQNGSGNTAVHSRRIHLENPYVKEKVHLLTEIGDSNRVRTVWFSSLAIATVVGTPLDLQQVDMLFTSLLVQATRAMQFADAQSRSGSRTTSFRKGFLAGFASRIGQRLRDADSRATVEAADEASIPVDDLLPILATKSEAVDAEFDRLFPRTRKARGRAVDAHGWYAGQAAADDATLAPGERALRR